MPKVLQESLSDTFSYYLNMDKEIHRELRLPLEKKGVRNVSGVNNTVITAGNMTLLSGKEFAENREYPGENWVFVINQY